MKKTLQEHADELDAEVMAGSTSWTAHGRKAGAAGLYDKVCHSVEDALSRNADLAVIVVKRLPDGGFQIRHWTDK